MGDFVIHNNERIPIPDNNTRFKALELSLKLRGKLTDKQTNVAIFQQFGEEASERAEEIRHRVEEVSTTAQGGGEDATT